MTTAKLKLTALSLSVALFGLACPAAKPDPVIPPTKAEPVLVKVFAINDLHGHMEGPSGSVKHDGQKIDAGGLDALAAHLNTLRAQHPNAAFVCAGDLVGASPLISAIFHDEPTVEAMNALQMDLLAVGNHEFDEGVDELMRLSKGGCHPEDGCKGRDSFEGAKFPFLAANVRFKDTKKTIFEPSLVKTYGDVKVGFIGLTFKDTPSAVSPSAVKSVEFLDEVETVNAQVKALQAQGVQTIVVVIHEGAMTESDADVNDCTNASGPIIDLTKRFDAAVDVVVSGHTHQAYNCTVEGKLLTSAKSYGRVLTEIDLKIDPTSGDVVEKSAKNIITSRDNITLDEGMVQHIDRYKQLVAPLAQQRIGMIKTDLLRQPNDAGESALGMLIADAQLAETQPATAGGAQIAFMNIGGVRNDLKMAPTSGESEGELTYNELHSVQPFGNTLVTMSLTGAQIEQLLEQQFGRDRPSILQPSAGFSYVWRAAGPDGDKVDPASIKLNGQPLDPAKTYRVTVNSFMATGGDGFSVLTQGTEQTGGRVDLDSFVDFVKARQTLEAPASGRIVKQ